MGKLVRHDVAFYVRTFGLTAFVETGLHEGDGVASATCHPFQSIHSVDLNERYVEAGRRNFAHDPRVCLWHGASQEVLETLLPTLDDHRILFWLDAHLPQNYEMDAGNELRMFPINAELEVISRVRPDKRDVILIDDMRLHDDLGCAAGSVPVRVELKSPDLNLPLGFRGRLVLRDNRDEGYLLICPGMKIL
jgi:hypothetical protein